MVICLFQAIQNKCAVAETWRSGVCNCSLLLFQPCLKGKIEQKFIKFMIAIKT